MRVTALVQGFVPAEAPRRLVPAQAIAIEEVDAAQHTLNINATFAKDFGNRLQMLRGFRRGTTKLNELTHLYACRVGGRQPCRAVYQQFGINRWSACVAVEISEVLANATEVNEPIN